MEANDLRNLSDEELDTMMNLIERAQLIMKNVIARTGEDRYRNEMYVMTIASELAILNELRHREMATTMREDLGM